MSEIAFQDADHFGGGNFEGVSFRDIIMNHLRRIANFNSVEFRGGYWETRIVPLGNNQTTEERRYILDSREVYSNSIQYLHDLLFPHFDEEMKKASETYSKELKKAFEDNTIVKEETRTEENPVFDRRGFEDVETRTFFRDIKVRLSRDLFIALSCFLHREKYLELGSIED